MIIYDGFITLHMKPILLQLGEKRTAHKKIRRVFTLDTQNSSIKS